MCTYLAVAYKNFLVKNQGTDFSFFYIPNVPPPFFLVLEAPSEAGRSSNWRDTKESVDGKGKLPISSWHNKKEKRRKWEGETVTVTILPFPSNYARVKAWATRKMILMLNHLPYFVYIKKALVLTTFQSDSFPPTLKRYQEARLTKI